MTIAAGFRCKNGVVLCADSEITYSDGTGKSYASKILPIQGGLSDSYFAYTGDQDFTEELHDDLRDATQGKTGKKLIDTVEKVYRHFWNKHYTQPPKAEKTWAHLLITCRIEDKIALYIARGRHFSRVPEREYRPLGIGKEAADSILKPFVETLGNFSTKMAAYLAIYALRQVKAYIQGCGGKTEIYEIPDEHDSLTLSALGYNWYSDSVKVAEEDCELFETQLRPLLLTFMQGNERAVRDQTKDVSKALLARLKTRAKTWY